MRLHGADGLIDALLNECFEQILDGLRAVPQPRDASRYLRALASAFVRFMLEHRTHYQLLTTPRHESPTELLPAAEEGRRLVEGALRDLAGQGRLSTEDIETAYQSLWVVLHGLVSVRIMRPDYPWSPQLVEVTLDAWESGMIRAGEA